VLTITVPKQEVFNEATDEFEDFPEIVLELEHSLVSLSKWESKFKKPFLTTEHKTVEEMAGYIEAMIVTPKNSRGVIFRLTEQNLMDINDYIESKESATTFGKMPQHKVRGETITSELIYYWLVTFNIPFEVETWHLNRLFSLIRICNVKNQKQKKMSPREIAMRNREINERRRAELSTRG
jgi:hypothetical protein